MRQKYANFLKGRARGIGAVLTSACLVGGAAVGLINSNVGGAGADTAGPVTFESGYSLGSVNGQDGWTSTGSYDQAVVDNSTIPGAPSSFGTKSLRISDAVTSGTFGDQTFSKSTVNAAGEPGADAGPYPVGTLESHFTASFDFASTTPLVYQPGSHMSVSPDRGDGARMSYVRIEDSATGFNLFFDDYVDIAPLGSPSNLDNGCQDTGSGPGNGDGVTGDGFREVEIASGVSRGAHNLKFDIQYVPGGHNDVVKISLDGTVIETGTSWEDYYRYCAESGGGTGGPLADQSRITRNLEFRESGTADPANSGKGLLIDGVTLTSASAPAAPHPVAAVPLNKAAKVNWVAQSSNGSPITGYTVTPYIGATAQAPRVFNSNATTETITGLTNGTAYTFKIAATNAIGTGPQSPPTGATIAGAPGKPGPATVTNGNSGVLKVAFKAPMNNGAAITNFTATCTSTDGGVTRARSKAAGSPIGVNALTPNKHYTCTVFATNSRGKGPRSNPSALKVA